MTDIVIPGSKPIGSPVATLVITPPYFGTSGDSIPSSFTTTVSSLTPDSVSVIITLSSSCSVTFSVVVVPQDAITRDRTITQLIIVQVIFLFILNSPPMLITV